MGMTFQQERLLIALARAYLWNSSGSTIVDVPEMAELDDALKAFDTRAATNQIANIATAERIANVG